MLDSSFVHLLRTKMCKLAYKAWYNHDGTQGGRRDNGAHMEMCRLVVLSLELKISSNCLLIITS